MPGIAHPGGGSILDKRERSGGETAGGVDAGVGEVEVDAVATGVIERDFAELELLARVATVLALEAEAVVGEGRRRGRLDEAQRPALCGNRPSEGAIVAARAKFARATLLHHAGAGERAARQFHGFAGCDIPLRRRAA